MDAIILMSKKYMYEICHGGTSNGVYNEADHKLDAFVKNYVSA